MRPRLVPLALLIFFVISGAHVSPATAQGIFLLDFDDDDNPYTIRTEVPPGVTSATARFILEFTDPSPWNCETQGWVTEGCCDFFYDGYYGVRCDWDTIAFDPAVVDLYTLNLPT